MAISLDFTIFVKSFYQLTPQLLFFINKDFTTVQVGYVETDNQIRFGLSPETQRTATHGKTSRDLQLQQ